MAVIGKEPLEIHLQEIRLVEVRGEPWVMLEQVAHAFRVDLDHLELEGGILQEIAGQDAGARADFQHGPAAAESSHDGLGDTLVGEEMLAEGLFGADRLLHYLAMKCLYIRSMPP